MLMCCVSLVTVSHYMKYSYLLTDEWANSLFVYRCLYLMGIVHRKVFELFMGFSSMEANFIACGQSYTPAKKSTDGKTAD